MADATAVALADELRPPLTESAAIAEADRCLECGRAHAPAPCTVACPAGIDVPSFIAAIAHGEPDVAADTIFAENLLGGTCARTCPVELLCEGACVLVHEGRPPIRIAGLQRFATDVALARPARATRTARPPTGKRVAVVGAGPAGLVCAGELALLGHDVTVFDERREAGGLVRFAIAPYRQLSEPLPAEVAMLERIGVAVRLGAAVDSPEALRQLELEYDAIFLGIGMGPDVDVQLPGDDLPGVWQSLEFVQALKTGRSPDVGSSVVVIGGGNTAIDMARESRRLGATAVTLVYRRTAAEMPAYPHEVEEARDEGVDFEWLAAPVRFLGTGRLEAVECVRTRLGEPDAGGRRTPEVVQGSEFELPAATAVLAIGQQPRSELLGWIHGLELARGHIVVDPGTGATTRPGYFAAGDATNGGATVVEAVRGAKTAAAGIDAWLGAGR